MDGVPKHWTEWGESNLLTLSSNTSQTPLCPFALQEQGCPLFSFGIDYPPPYAGEARGVHNVRADRYMLSWKHPKDAVIGSARLWEQKARDHMCYKHLLTCHQPHRHCGQPPTCKVIWSFMWCLTASFNASAYLVESKGLIQNPLHIKEKRFFSPKLIISEASHF